MLSKSFLLTATLTLTLIPFVNYQQPGLAENLPPTPILGSINTTLVKNATYQIPGRGSFTLINGNYETTAGTPFSVTLNKEMAFGDLDRDGIGDAIVILELKDSNPEVSSYLAVVISQQGTPQNVDTELLGKRLQVKSINIQDGNVNLAMLKYRPDDQPCCPSESVDRSYFWNSSTQELVVNSLQDDRSNKPEVDVSPAPTLGTGDNVPTPPPEGEIKIQF